MTRVITCDICGKQKRVEVSTYQWKRKENSGEKRGRTVYCCSFTCWERLNELRQQKKRMV